MIRNEGSKGNLEGEIDVVVFVHDSISEDDIVEDDVEEAKSDHFDEVVAQRVQCVEIFDKEDSGQIVESVADQEAQAQQDFSHKVCFELAEGDDVRGKEGVVFCKGSGIGNDMQGECFLLCVWGIGWCSLGITLKRCIIFEYNVRNKNG